MICRVDPPSFGINYGSISCGQLYGYIVFCTVPILRASPPEKEKTKFNVDRNLAKRNEFIIYAKAERTYCTLYLALLFLIMYTFKAG